MLLLSKKLLVVYYNSLYMYNSLLYIIVLEYILTLEQQKKPVIFLKKSFVLKSLNDSISFQKGFSSIVM